ncbi:uncharacterized protein LOC132787525 isoform X1 [Drosophila nasuta]|uniref:uncharacterized protein LOC132787525 isoform X1 n=1 Tax=Drosophila nasuta TaxID=42062 RepID=UPI00295EF81C|nr:uncharacterized protein LOC132787525 isoform X1 [Drosophila nasuta]
MASGAHLKLQLIVLFLVVAIRPNAGQQDNATTIDSYARLVAPILEHLNDTLQLHLNNLRESDNLLVKCLLQQTNIPIVVSNDMSVTQSVFVSKLLHHFLIYDTVQELEEQLYQFSDTGNFYIIALLHTIEEEQQRLQQFMQTVWYQQGHNRIYYIRQQAEQLLLYNPFQDSIVLVQDAFSYRRIYANLHGYALRAYIFDSVYSALYGDGEKQQVLRVTGPDANVGEIVAKKLNLTLNYVWPDDEFFGGLMPDGNYSGGVGRAHRHELDVIFAGFFIKDYLTTRIQFSAAVYMDDLCLYVQKAQRIPQSIVPLFAVRPDVWLCFLLVGIICAFIWMCLRALNLSLHIERIQEQQLDSRKDVHYLSTAWRIFIDTWVVWVRVNIVQYPPYNSERIFLVSICLVSVIFGALLESSLATAYIRPLYYRDPNTLAELDASQLPIYIKHPAFKDDLFYGHDSEVYRRLDAKMMLVGEGEDRLINMVSRLGKFAGVTRSASLELSDRRYIQTHKVHKIPECPKTYHIGYVLPKPSAYLEGINAILQQILAGGLLDFWIDEMKERAKMNIFQYPEYLAELNASRWKVFTLKDVQLAFYALAIGCALAAVVWLLELWLK